jgi:hypothetical protein
VEGLEQLLEHVAVGISGQSDLLLFSEISQVIRDAVAKIGGVLAIRLGHVESENRVALVVVIFSGVNPKALEKLPIAFEELSYGVKQESLAESPGTGQETAPESRNQFVDVLGLVGIKIVPGDD